MLPISKKPKLIGLYSSLPQSGKSTFAKALVEKGFTRLSFATPIKEMVSLLVWHLHDSNIISKPLEDIKTEVLPLIGKTPRELMQTLGTDWGRDMIGPNMWASIGEQRAKAFLDQGQDVVFDDMRFSNEHTMITRLGGFTVKINRRAAPDPKHIGIAGHPSEGGLVARGMDYEFTIDEGIAAVRQAAFSLLEELK